MPDYHTMVSDGIVARYDTHYAATPQRAMEIAVDIWEIRGGYADRIAKKAVYALRPGDPVFDYERMPPDTLADRPNLLEGSG